MANLLKQSSTAQELLFQLIDSTDHLTGKTGVTPTVTIRKAGGAFATPAGAVSEIANGWYRVAGNATDTNTLGSLLVHATGSGCDPVDVPYQVVAFDPSLAYVTPGTGAGQIEVDGSGGVRLAANGLDSITATDPSGTPSGWNFRQKLLWVFRRLVRGTLDTSANTLIVKDASGATISTQSATTSGTTQTTGELA